MKKLFLVAMAAAVLSGPAMAQSASLDGVDAGTYVLDKTHAYTTFSVSHGGLSDYVVNLTGIDATIEFDPAKVESSSISMTIDPSKLKTYYPGDYKAGHAKSPYNSWDEHLSQSPKYLNAGAFPKVTFTSTDVIKTGAASGKVTGDLTFLGITKPLTMDVTYNGVVNVPWMGDTDIIGFDAVGVMTRSMFGMPVRAGGVGDDVTIRFSGEFVNSGK